MRGVASRLKGDGAGRHGRTGLLLLLHDSLVCGFYRDGETETVIDFDSMPENVLDIPGRYSDHQFSQELQALYTGDRLQGVVGFYYLNATAAGAFDTIIGRAGIVTGTAGKIETKSWSVFGDFSYDVTDALAVSLGGRSAGGGAPRPAMAPAGGGGCCGGGCCGGG